MRKKSRLVVFLIPPDKIVNGGILSIFSIAKISREFHDAHKAEVIIATYPGTPSYGRNDLFENEETIQSFDEVMAAGVPDYLLIHVPEYASYNTFMTFQAPQYRRYLDAVKDLHINIMNQNMLLMQDPTVVANWFAITPHVTQTTAHVKYTSQAIADRYNLPTHYFSTWVDQSQYKNTPYAQKENLIALSNDTMPQKSSIVKRLKRELPEYEIVTIQDMTYEVYKATIARAKFTITFGEGFDGYYNESFLSGGITFAVYNEDFFPDTDYKDFDNVYASYDAMLKNIVSDIKRLDYESAYKKVSRASIAKTNHYYSFAAYINNIGDFYRGNYTYRPSPISGNILLGEVIRDKWQLENSKNAELAQKEQTINDKIKEIQDLAAQVIGMEQSQSWRLTKPLRQVSARVKKPGR